MTGQYYFLVSLLPELKIGYASPIDFDALVHTLELNLSPKDLKKVLYLRRYIDIQNLKSLYWDQPLDPRGSMTKTELESFIETQSWTEYEECSPEMSDILSRYHEDPDTVCSQALSQFLRESIPSFSGFMSDFFMMEYQMRLVLLGLRCSYLGQDMLPQLQFEDVHDPFIAQIVAQNRSPSFEPPFEYADLKPLYESYVDNPNQLHHALLEYRFEKLQTMGFTNHFGIDRILSFIVRFSIVERYHDLNLEQGVRIIDLIERNIPC